MNLIVSEDKNPYRNLATEEYLLKHSSEDFVFLYINHPCVVVGKHQIAQKEINSIYTFKNNILISRRLSGGGAVYHDEGNLNFSFIRTILPGENISYQQITRSVFKFLKTIGLDVILSPRNDLMITEKKISGSAMHVYKNRVMAHCTLLINSDLENLSKSLKGNPERYSDRSIDSHRSKVLNLADIDNQLSSEFLTSEFCTFLQTEIPEIRNRPALTEDSLAIIKQLCHNKYSASEWIYGYSPKYLFRNSIQLEKNSINIILEIEKGVIKKSEVESINELTGDIIHILKNLKGKSHNINSISEWLKREISLEYGNKILDFIF